MATTSHRRFQLTTRGMMKSVLVIAAICAFPGLLAPFSFVTAGIYAIGGIALASIYNFKLIEVLVVISIFGVMLSLFAPAIQTRCGPRRPNPVIVTPAELSEQEELDWQLFEDEWLVTKPETPDHINQKNEHK